MAELHLISPPEDGSAAERCFQALASAHAQGVDLGPRGPHIRALSQSIEALLIALRQEHDALTRSLAADTPEVREVLSAISSLNAILQPLIQAARTCPL